MCDSRKKPVPGAWMREHERVVKTGYKGSAGESVRGPFLYSFVESSAIKGGASILRRRFYNPPEADPRP